MFEALAMGAVPVVVDFGGTGDIANPEVGFKVPLTNEEDIVFQIERVLAPCWRSENFFGTLVPTRHALCPRMLELGR